MVLDLGLMMDSFDMNFSWNWERLKMFTKNFISNVFMFINDTRISIIVFNTNPSIELRFDERYSFQRVIRVRQQYVTTSNVDKALIMADQVMFREENGMRRHSSKVTQFLYSE